MQNKDFNLQEEETIDLIASGYEWVCPSCDTYNHQPETSEFVVCQECEKHFEVGSIFDAIP